MELRENAQTGLADIREKQQEEDARRIAERKARQPGALRPVTIGSQTINFRYCPATTSAEWKLISGDKDYFMMGSPYGEAGREKEEVQHPVRLTHGFWIGETEVTRKLWQEVMGEKQSSSGSDADKAVEDISWNVGCQRFLTRINELADAQRLGCEFCLPTEAQWEYACRAGTTGPYGISGDIEGFGWCGKRGRWPRVHIVGEKGVANAWGLYDMHGNVWEFCQDCHGSYPSGMVTNPLNTEGSQDRIVRGGSYMSSATKCRSAQRQTIAPNLKPLGEVGLRLVINDDK